jgi:hypothetical protein
MQRFPSRGVITVPAQPERKLIQLDKEYTKEMLATARHYGAMRFNMMAAFFILSGLLVNAASNPVSRFQPNSLAPFGALASFWFLLFEFLLSYNLTKIWTNIINNGAEDVKGAWPHRGWIFVWTARLLLPAPYLVSLYAWLAMWPTTSSISFVPYSVPVVLWILMWISWVRAQAGKPSTV